MNKVTFEKETITISMLATNVSEMWPFKSIALSFSQHDTIA